MSDALPISTLRAGRYVGGYTRYTDDLVLSSDSARGLAKAHPFIAHIIHDSGFRLNKRMTSLIGPRGAKMVTGFVSGSDANVFANCAFVVGHSGPEPEANGLGISRGVCSKAARDAVGALGREAGDGAATAVTGTGAGEAFLATLSEYHRTQLACSPFGRRTRRG